MSSELASYVCYSALKLNLNTENALGVKKEITGVFFPVKEQLRKTVILCENSHKRCSFFYREDLCSFSLI